MSKRVRVRYFQVCLWEDVVGVRVDELDNRGHFDGVREAHLGILPIVNRMRSQNGLAACGCSNVIGEGYEALVLYMGGALSVRDQVKAEAMVEAYMKGGGG